jgi:hypothetical protein
MPIVTQALPEPARLGLARIGLDEVALGIIGAGDDLVESEKAFRQAERLEAVRADTGRVNATRAREGMFNASGVRRMDRVLTELQGARSRLAPDTLRQIDESIGTQEFRDALSEAQDLFQDTMVRTDISGGEAQEVLGLWNEAQTALQERGFNGLLDRGRDTAQRVREVRQRPDRGRVPHSPLDEWKYYIIAGALVVGVAAIIVCFIWFGCSWVAALLNFFGLGWITEMIKQGC